MKPLRRAILWNDIRCNREAEYAAEKLGKLHIFDRTGYPPGQWTLYKALWLKNNEPEVYDKIFKLVLVQDYLIYRLTGNLVTLSGAGTMTGALDIEKPDRWAYDIIGALGVREDIWIDKILPGGTIAGQVTKEAALETGLPEGLPVVTGAGDQPCGILGAGVTQPGEIGINGGTSCTNEFVSAGVPKREAVNYFIELSPSGDYILENYIPGGKREKKCLGNHLQSGRRKPGGKPRYDDCALFSGGQRSLLGSECPRNDDGAAYRIRSPPCRTRHYGRAGL